MNFAQCTVQAAQSRGGQARDHQVCSTWNTNSSSARCSRRARFCVSKAERNQSDKDGTGEIVRAIAEGFVQACVPGPRSYEDSLKDYVRAVLLAYQKGYSLTALQFELQAAQDPNARRLAQDELELRTLWTSLIFKTLRCMKIPRDSAGGEELLEAAPDAFDAFVAGILQAVNNGYDLGRIQLEQTVAGSDNTSSSISGVDSSIISEQQQQNRNNFEAAVLRQSTRIVYYTIQVASDTSDGSASS